MRPIINRFFSGHSPQTDWLTVTLDNLKLIKMTERINWIDTTRIIAIFAVLANHSLARYIWEWGQIPYTDWVIAAFSGAVIRFAVPVFIILSGYLLLDKQENTYLFFRNRLHKVVIPLLAWSVIYTVFKTNSIYSIFTIEFVKELLSGNVYFHLYFLYIMIGLYIITPVLRVILDNINIKYIFYYITIWFISNPINTLFSYVGFGFYNMFDFANGYIGYYLIGYVLKKIQLTQKMMTLVSISTIMSLVMMFLLTCYFTTINNKACNAFIYGLTLPVVLYSTCIFIILKEYFKNVNFSPVQKKIIYSVSSTTMGIYLIHPIFLKFISTGFFGSFFDDYRTLNSYISPVVSVPIVIFGMFICSFMSILLIQKIPIIRNLAP